MVALLAILTEIAFQLLIVGCLAKVSIWLGTAYGTLLLRNWYTTWMTGYIQKQQMQEILDKLKKTQQSTQEAKIMSLYKNTDDDDDNKPA